MRKSDAILSEDRKYRYELTRVWDASKPLVAFCMLNPSAADEIENDPTITRCQKRARLMGFGGLVVVNIFAYRSTDPEELYDIEDPIGRMNDDFIRNAASNAAMFICGWGKYGSILSRGQKVLDMVQHEGAIPYALKINQDGSPSHPLYISYKVKPVDMSAVRTVF